jgi:hypothetical protein
MPWYVELPTGVAGPIRSSTLINMARNGSITPATRISKDKIKWFRAKRAKRLFPDPSMISTTTLPSSLPSSDLPFILLNRYWYYTQVVAVYQDSIVLGYYRFLTPPITSHHLEPDGRDALCRILLRPSLFESSTISAILETLPWSPLSQNAKLTGCFYGRFAFSLVHDPPFTIHTAYGQAIGLRNALHTAFGDKIKIEYYVPPRPVPWSARKQSLIAATAFSCIAASIYFTISSSLCNSIIVLVLSFFFGIILHFAIIWLNYIRVNRRVGCYQEFCSELQRHALKTAENKMRHIPYRSLWAGSLWAGRAAKALAILYLVPLYCYFYPYIDRSATISVQKHWASMLANIPAALLLFAGYSLSQGARQHRTKLSEEILFLRPFQDDNSVSLQPVGLAGELSGLSTYFGEWFIGDFGFFRPKAAFERLHVQAGVFLSLNPIRFVKMLFDISSATAEESLSREFSKIGNPIAIGQPGSWVDVPGAAKTYVPDNEWQLKVADLICRAKIIVLQPGASQGVAWEMQRIREMAAPRRLLLNLASFRGDPSGFSAPRKLIQEHLGVSLPRTVPYLDNKIFVWFDEHWKPQVEEVEYKSPLIWPFTSDAVDFKRTLGRFLAQLEERPVPDKSTRSVTWVSKAIWRVSLVLSSLLSLAICVLMMMCVQGSFDAPSMLLKSVFRTSREYEARRMVEQFMATPLPAGRTLEQRHFVENETTVGRTMFHGEKMIYSARLRDEDQASKSPDQDSFGVLDGFYEVLVRHPVEFGIQSKSGNKLIYFGDLDINQSKWDDCLTRMVVLNMENGYDMKLRSNESLFVDRMPGRSFVAELSGRDGEVSILAVCLVWTGESTALVECRFLINEHYEQNWATWQRLRESLEIRIEPNQSLGSKRISKEVDLDLDLDGNIFLE